IALTGLMWAFDWFSHSVEWIANGGKTIEKEKVKVVSTLAPLVSDYPLDIVHNSLRKNHPQAKIYSISLPQDSLGTIGTFVVYNEKIRGVYLQFDQYSGEPLHAEGKWEDKTNGEKVWAYNYDIHTGAIGGIVGKTIAFFVSLFSASLPVTGFLIWYSRNKKKKKLKRTGGSRGAKKVAKGVAVNKLNPRPVLKKPVIKKQLESEEFLEN
ncbi:MAG: PepSY-associated TM helix domain-containing protein, partial [Bacteroidota bacterium]